MIIQSSKDVAVARRTIETEDAPKDEAEVVVTPGAAGDGATEEDMSSLTALLGRDGRVQQFTIRTDGSGPELDSFLQGVAVLSREPGISFERTGAGAVLGGMGGVAVGAILNETMRLGQQSGNPLISTFALACGLAGAAVGGGIGARLIDITVSKADKGWRAQASSKET